MTEPAPIDALGSAASTQRPAEASDDGPTSGRRRPTARSSRLAGLVYLRQRLTMYLIVAFASVLVNFILPRFMPGDPATQMIRDITNRTGAPPSGYQTRMIKARYGDPERPVLLQFWDYISRLVQGDLGQSSQYYPIPVTELIGRALPWTLYLAIVSTILGWMIGTYLGARLGWRPGRRLDAILTPVSMFFSSIPAFWLGLLIVWYLAYSNGWFPNQGAYNNSLEIDFSDPDFYLSALYHGALPLVTLIIVGFARWLFSMRNMMITTVNEDYVQLARAKGLPENRIRNRYAARNALLPNFTGLAQSMGGALTAVILAETVFIYPGIGSLLTGAQAARDYPVMQGVMLMVIFASLLFNFIADSVYVLLDPRTREVT
ncbi:ABC transporter permease [Brachybacterium sp. FME24]|uniref:ABC transporter permease n=1 Tax=Brachybacterium sp. FME24 TaxID=2742605 RepID=UPI0018679C72|nr:ABC transporter permease [Brachybacterium sp. FME24]